MEEIPDMNSALLSDDETMKIVRSRRKSSRRVPDVVKQEVLSIKKPEVDEASDGSDLVKNYAKDVSNLDEHEKFSKSLSSRKSVPQPELPTKQVENGKEGISKTHDHSIVTAADRNVGRRHRHSEYRPEKAEESERHQTTNGKSKSLPVGNDHVDNRVPTSHQVHPVRNRRNRTEPELPDLPDDSHLPIEHRQMRRSAVGTGGKLQSQDPEPKNIAALKSAYEPPSKRRRTIIVPQVPKNIAALKTDYEPPSKRRRTIIVVNEEEDPETIKPVLPAEELLASINFPRARRSGLSGAEEIFGKSPEIALKMLSDIYKNRDDDDASSSDSEDRHWGTPEEYLRELDCEWLGVEKEERRTTIASLLSERRKSTLPAIPERHFFLSSAEHHLDLGCEEFMEATKYVWLFLALGGRMPFQSYIEDHVVKFRLKMYSLTFVCFLLTAFFLTMCTTTMAYSLFVLLLVQPVQNNTYQRVERLEVDKYWPYALVTLASSALSSSWSLAIIFDDGYALAEFLSRWNVGISVLKYRPAARLRSYFWINIIAYLLYAVIVIYLFTTEEGDRFHVPIVRGASGLIGLMMFYPFWPEVRFSESYRFYEMMGLFVHLYAMYSSRTIMIMVTIYARALVNMGRKWNLRLAYVLGMLGGTFKDAKIVAVISFPKLFAEHKAVVGFLRHSGRVFTVALGIFYTLKMVELLVLGYRAIVLIVFPMPVFDNIFVEGTPDYLPRIKCADPLLVLVGTSIFIFLHSIAEWLLFSEQIIACGDTILNGFSFIRRFGLILSKTSQRRRFVQSLNHGFSQLTECYMKAGYTIHREFIFNTFFWLASFAVVLTAFSLFQLETDFITVCSTDGRCVTITRTAIAWKGSGPGKQTLIETITNQVFGGIMTAEPFPLTTTLPSSELPTTTVAPISATTMPTTTTELPTATTVSTSTLSTTTTTPTTTTRTPTTTTTATTTTTPTTIRPPELTHKCPAIWDDAPTITMIEIPNVCRRDGTLHQPYVDSRGVRSDCEIAPGILLGATHDNRKPFEDMMPQGFSCNMPIGGPQIVYDRDTCGNIQLTRPDTKLASVLRAVIVSHTDGFLGVFGTPTDYVFCCYDYGFGSQQLAECNQAYTQSRGSRCGFPLPPGRPTKPPFLFSQLVPALRTCIMNNNVGAGCALVNRCFCDPGASNGLGNHAIVTVTTSLFGSTTTITCPPTIP